jgi:hypothetical protein
MVDEPGKPEILGGSAPYRNQRYSGEKDLQRPRHLDSLSRSLDPIQSSENA